MHTTNDVRLTFGPPAKCMPPVRWPLPPSAAHQLQILSAARGPKVNKKDFRPTRKTSINVKRTRNLLYVTQNRAI